MSPDDGFDPLAEIAQGNFANREELQEVNLRVLTPFQRALLVIDGTVTRFIEAYTMEPVEVQRIRQDACAPRDEHRWLGADSSSEILEREVLIRGGYSGTLYVYAISHVMTGRLSPRIRDRLEVQGEGIGRIFEDEKLETRREVLWFGRERLKALPAALEPEGQTEFISRAYRIIVGGHPVVIINERFPVSLRRIPAHH